MLGWAENRALLLLLSWKVSACPLSSAGPALMAVAQPVTVCAAASSSTAWSAPLVNEGASLTAPTTTVKVRAGLVSCPPLLVPPASRRRKVKSADPVALAPGTNRKASPVMPDAATCCPALTGSPPSSSVPQAGRVSTSTSLSASGGLSLGSLYPKSATAKLYASSSRM